MHGADRLTFGWDQTCVVVQGVGIKPRLGWTEACGWLHGPILFGVLRSPNQIPLLGRCHPADSPRASA